MEKNSIAIFSGTLNQIKFSLALVKKAYMKYIVLQGFIEIMYIFQIIGVNAFASQKYQRGTVGAVSLTWYD